MTSARQNLIGLVTSLAQDCSLSESLIRHCCQFIETRGYQNFALEVNGVKSVFLSTIENPSTAEIGRGVLGRYFQKIANQINSDPTSVESMELFRASYQFLSFLGKAQDVNSNVRADKLSFQKYVAVDSELPANSVEFYSRFYKTCSRELIGAIRENLFHLLGNLVPINNGVFGPGSVNDSTFSEKYVAPLWCNDDSVRYSGIYSEDHFLASLDRFPARNHYDFFGVYENRSEFLLVPKDIRGPRTICRESTGNSIHQQALRLLHQDAIHRNSGGFVNFSDQSPNQLLALTSSHNRRFATIDLKDASDRVSFACVSSLFPEDVVRECLKSRSSQVYFREGSNTHVHTLRKWAPMGSAICFTTLSALVYSVCTAAAPNQPIYVYGDDLIIPVDVVDQCIVALEAVGLLVNKLKSYRYSFFRESCGMDAYLGYDCTPVKLRYVPSPESFQEASLASLCSTAHQLYDRGYTLTAVCLQGLILGLKPRGVDVPQGRVTDPFLTVPLSYAPNRKEVWRVDPSLQLRYKKLRLAYLVDKTTKTSENDTLYYYRAVTRSLVSSDEVLDSRFDGRVSKRDVTLKFRTSRVVLDGATGVRVIG